MDPDVALASLRALLARIQTESEEGYEVTPWEEELSFQVQALDEWLTTGGFLPRDWTLTQPMVYTADSIKADLDTTDGRLCGAQRQAPCGVEGCDLPHEQICCRPTGHALDIHVAIGLAIDGSEITAVWLAR